MRLYVTSDLHLEFGDLKIRNEHDVDVLILGGDICIARELDTDAGQYVRDFFQRCSNEFPHVIYIMGNHEHYHGDFSKSAASIRGMIDRDQLNNLYFLDKSTVTIQDYLFIGGTLWTDFNRGDPLTMQSAAWSMNDYRGVKHSDKGHAGGIWKFIPQDALDDHRQMLEFIDQTIQARRDSGDHSDRVVVVGHHSPSRQSTHPRYKTEFVMNGAYSSDLDGFIMDRPEICLWTHGHTHEDFDYKINNTRVICNPRGYIGYEPRAENWQPKLVELP